MAAYDNREKDRITSKAFQQYIKKNFFYETLAGRVAFIDPTTGKPMKGNNSGTTIVYFKKDITR